MHDRVVERCSEGMAPAVLADIYDKETHIAIWKRKLPDSLCKAVAEFISTNPTFKMSVTVTPNNAQATLNESMGHLSSPDICEDIAELVDMFCLLFNLEHAGVRLAVLDTAMCPKFHVDRNGCRLLTTYQGVATEWLPHEHVDRSKLGHGSGGLADHESGLFAHEQDIQQLHHGDVAILKGDLWDGNEGNGLVHRSPCMENSRRLLLTMDLMN